jgi:segregation and condensation protein B
MTHDNAAGDAAGESPADPGLRACLEAILLVVDEPVPEVVLAQVLERPREEVAREIADLAASYTAEGRGFDLREVAGGWRFYTREECAPVVERFVRDGQEVRLTQAALETLAVVAYRQPVSRARVSAVRGVNCDGVMRTLTLRGLVEEAGTEHETGAILYRTTGYFLERLGLPSLDDLPDLAPFLPDEIEDADGSEEDAADFVGVPGPGGAANGSAPDSGGATDPSGALDPGGALDSDGARDSGDAVEPGGAPGPGGAGEPESARDPQDADDAGDERTSP